MLGMRFIAGAVVIEGHRGVFFYAVQGLCLCRAGLTACCSLSSSGLCASKQALVGWREGTKRAGRTGEAGCRSEDPCLGVWVCVCVYLLQTDAVPVPEGLINRWMCCVYGCVRAWGGRRFSVANCDVHTLLLLLHQCVQQCWYLYYIHVCPSSSVFYGGEKAHSQAVAAGGTEPDDEHPSSQWAIFFPSSPSMVLLGLEMHITYKNSHLVYLRSAIGDQRSSLFFVVAPPPTVAQKRRRRRQRRWRRKRGVPFSLEPIDGDGNEK